MRPGYVSIAISLGRRLTLLSAIVVNPLQIKGVNVTGEIAETSEQNVDQEVDAAATDKENSDGRD